MLSSYRKMQTRSVDESSTDTGMIIITHNAHVENRNLINFNWIKFK